MDANLNAILADDPLDVASKAAIAPRSYYGQIQIDAYFCVLVKGTGKTPFDPAQHSVDDRRTAIDISLLPLPEQNVRFNIRRDTIAESREWAGIIWPSLKALGLTNARDAHNKWAKLQQVPSGRKYRSSTGEEKEATTFKFLALYADEGACRAAYLADTGKSNGNGSSAPAPAPSAPASAGPSTHDLDVARQFVYAFAKQNQYALDKTRAACASQQIITKVIDINSPAFATMVAEAVSAA